MFSMPVFHSRFPTLVMQARGRLGHNRRRDTLAQSCCLTHLSVRAEVDNNLILPGHGHPSLADALLLNWTRDVIAAFDLSLKHTA